MTQSVFVHFQRPLRSVLSLKFESFCQSFCSVNMDFDSNFDFGLHFTQPDPFLICENNEVDYMSDNDLLQTVENIENNCCDFVSPQPGSGSLDTSSANSRFVIALDKEIDGITASRIPPNTRQNTNWARNVYSEWAAFRNAQPNIWSEPLGPVPNTFEFVAPERISHWLSRFVVEARRSNGKPYPPRTLHRIISGLQRYYIEEKGINKCGFLIKLQAVFVTHWTE